MHLMSTSRYKSHSSPPIRTSSRQGDTARATRHSNIETIISRILQIGVIVSSVTILTGLLLFLFFSGNFSTLSTEDFPHTPGEALSGLLALQPQALIEVGLMLLIITPVLRVVASIVAFNMEHDRRFVLISFLLLAILITSFILGKGGA